MAKPRETVSIFISFNERLFPWFYRRIQFTIEYRAPGRGLNVEYVNPRDISSRRPRCGSE